MLWRHPIRREDTELRKHFQKEFVKILDCRLRNECQNENLFQTLSHARHLITAWRDDDNHHHRPHTSLDGQEEDRAEIAGAEDDPGPLEQLFGMLSMWMLQSLREVLDGAT